MAVAPTVVIRQNQIAQNRFITVLQANATGDGSGGSVTVTQDLSQLVRPKDFVIVTRSFMYQNNGVTDVQYIKLVADHWEYLCSNPATTNPSVIMYACNTGIDGWYGVGYYHNQNAHRFPLPLQLGNPMVASPTIEFTNSVNTNSKLYSWGVTLLHIRS